MVVANVKVFPKVIIDSGFSLFEAPTSTNELINTTTGLVHCVARREYSGGNRRIVFYLENDYHAGVPPKPVFVAQKQKEGKFYIFNVSETGYRVERCHYRTKETATYVGKTRQKKLPNSRFLLNTLYRGTGDTKQQVECMIYDRITLRYPVLEGYPDRVVYSIVAEPPKKKTNPNEKAAARLQEATSILGPIVTCATPRIEDAIRYHVNDVQEINDTYHGLHAMKSRRRPPLFPKNSTASAAADGVRDESVFVRYRGRVGRSSRKNIQMIDPVTHAVVFQMARWNEDEFTVDFAAPYSAYQAFGAALAQLES